jgi:L-alanine-DL-glutamate epimerase-like enolase superfamily enzyme
MKRLALDIAKVTESFPGREHPVEINHQLEPLYFDAAKAIALAEPIPKLCTLVVASAFDAAIHDGFGKAFKVSCYGTYGPQHMTSDLSRYLDDSFRGEYLDQYVSARPADWLYVYHLAGALDPLVAADVTSPLDDGLPATLEEWVRVEGVNHIKIKLDGDHLAWDVERVMAVNRVLMTIDGGADWRYSLDFNERCPDAEYVLECFARIREGAPDAFHRIQYVEQPTHRNLNPPGSPDMHAVAKLKPVVIDESLVDYESLLRARELGYSGVALKACKGQSNALLMAAAARKFGMFLCVQDLTCPGASLLHSAGLAAHIPPVSAVESNGRQYVPAANEPWKSRFPGIFRIEGGRMRTGSLTGVGLGIVPPATRSIHA